MMPPRERLRLARRPPAMPVEKRTVPSPCPGWPPAWTASISGSRPPRQSADRAPRLVRQVQQLHLRATQQPGAVHRQADTQVVVVTSPATQAFVVALNAFQLLPRQCDRAVELERIAGIRRLRIERGRRTEFPQLRIRPEPDAPQRHPARLRPDRAKRLRQHIGDEHRLGRADQHDLVRRMPDADVDGLARWLPSMGLVVDEDLPADVRILPGQLDHA